MINQEDYSMIADYDCMGVEERGNIIETKGEQVMKPIIIIKRIQMAYISLENRTFFPLT